MAKDIKIKVTGDTKDLNQSLDKAKKKTEELGNQSKGISGLANTFKALGAAAVAYIGVQGVKALVNFAGEIDTVKTAFKGLTSSTDMGGKKLVASMKEMSRTIAKLDIMKSSNLLYD